MFLLLGALVLSGCTSSKTPPPAHLPPPITSTTVGVGDSLTIQLVGEKELPSDFRIAPDGTIDYPYVGRVKVAGMEPEGIVDVLKQKLVDAKVLTDPQMSLAVKEYVSKTVTVVGQVGKPGTVSWTNGMKLVDALSQVGWFTAMADSNHVVLTRAIPPNKSITAIVSVDAITDGKQSDILLQAGDTIKVESRVF
jgi:protein involved in polysaccharide export with SLBB domain